MIEKQQLDEIKNRDFFEKKNHYIEYQDIESELICLFTIIRYHA